MVHLAWLCVTGLNCGSSGLVVCDRSELWFIWLFKSVTDLNCGSSGLVVCDRSELLFIWLGCL